MCWPPESHGRPEFGAKKWLNSVVYGRYTELDNYSIHGVNLNQRSHPWGAHPVPFAINAARTWRGRGCDATPHG